VNFKIGDKIFDTKTNLFGTVDYIDVSEPPLIHYQIENTSDHNFNYPELLRHVVDTKELKPQLRAE
jgi:hypothetical protein